MWNFIVKKKKEDKPINQLVEHLLQIFVVLVRGAFEVNLIVFVREFPTGHM